MIQRTREDAEHNLEVNYGAFNLYTARNLNYDVRLDCWSSPGPSIHISRNLEATFDYVVDNVSGLLIFDVFLGLR